MAYTDRARELRQCRYLYPETDTKGRPHPRAHQQCAAYARWDAADGKCNAHSVGPGGERYTRGPDTGMRREMAPYCSTRPVCTCRAYRFPHRPGGGYCFWPEEGWLEAPPPPKRRRSRLRWRHRLGESWPTKLRRFKVIPNPPHE